MPSQEAKTPDKLLQLVLVCVFVAVILFPLASWWNQRQAHVLRELVSQSLKAEDWPAAEQAARKWTRREPENSDAWLDLAEACRQQNKFVETADALGQISDTDPRVLKSLAIRTDLLLSELQNPIKAIETCQRILKIDPRADRARQRLIYIDAMMLRRLEMVKEIRQAMELHCEPPEAYIYLLLSDSLNFGNGAPLVSSWLKSDPKNEDLQVAMAIYVARSGSHRSMVLNDSKVIKGGDQSLIANCLEKFPSNKEVLAFYLEKNLEQGDLERVAELLEAVPADAEDDNRFWRFKGRFLALKNQIDLAEESYRQALKRNPYDWLSRLGLAEILRRKGNTSEAQEMARLGAKGKAFSKELMQLENPKAINLPLLQEIGEYAQDCGDKQVLFSIQKRLDITTK
ncbi:tetratricopeptide repeat protein [Gimesia fumaroli]|uniref:Tetratricopeptide repeat protein n=1 Tax=Gimesia fumaroli TaxID=2527976 RepID=A0A518I9Z5_9PLAN|nr:tetratricopeptide repeat protein [Gimesia fumaroli]QDV49945.1 Tetratricopeptide repeat protein [Gimesia fumaroli]